MPFCLELPFKLVGVAAGWTGAADDDKFVLLPFNKTGFGGILSTGVDGVLPPNPDTVEPCGVLSDGRLACDGLEGARVPLAGASRLVERLMISLP